MSQEEHNVGLPSAAGSPFKTKNFNKFFFGIMIAAIVIVFAMMAYFVLVARHHQPASRPTSLLLPPQRALATPCSPDPQLT